MSADAKLIGEVLLVAPLLVYSIFFALRHEAGWTYVTRSYPAGTRKRIRVSYWVKLDSSNRALSPSPSICTTAAHPASNSQSLESIILEVWHELRNWPSLQKADPTWSPPAGTGVHGMLIGDEGWASWCFHGWAFELDCEVTGQTSGQPDHLPLATIKLSTDGIEVARMSCVGKGFKGHIRWELRQVIESTDGPWREVLDSFWSELDNHDQRRRCNSLGIGVRINKKFIT